jgi:hypothetical protein
VPTRLKSRAYLCGALEAIDRIKLAEWYENGQIKS